MLARTAVSNVIVGKPSVLDAIVAEIRERGYDQGRIGIVEYDPYTSIPKNHWDHFTTNLPQAELVPVTKEFVAMKGHTIIEDHVIYLDEGSIFQRIGTKAKPLIRPNLSKL